MNTPENKSVVAGTHQGPQPWPDTRSNLEAIGRRLDEAGARQIDIDPAMLKKYRDVIDSALGSSNERVQAAAMKCAQRALEYNLKRASEIDKIDKGGNGPAQTVTKVYVNTGPSE